MRKVLLTTTALVALGGVSAASALDIAGYQRFSYTSWDDTGGTDETGGANDSAFYDRNRLNLSHSITSDSGLTVSGFYRIQNLAEAYNDISVSGNFGTMSFGNYNTAGAVIYTSVINNGDYLFRTGQTFAGVNGNPMATSTDGAAAMSATYASPNFNGLSFMASFQDSGSAAATGNDATELGINYAGSVGDSSFSVHYLNNDIGDTTGVAGDEQENQQYGFDFNTGPFGFVFQREVASTKDTAGEETAEIKTNEYAVKYQATDAINLGIIKLASDDKLDTTNNPKLDAMVYAVNYAVFPGFRLQASHTTFDYEGATNNEGSATTFGLRVDF
jgi:hypothetical protein